MQRPRLLFLLALVGVVAAGCDDDLTSPDPIPGPNTVISDGATGGISDDVFFLPPLVPNPSGSSFFDAGEFNPNLTSAVIRVCHMVSDVCTPVATFGTGANVTGPIKISLVDEHYLALWHTDESNPALIPGDAYRIQVFADADVSKEPVAWADVEVAATGRELHNIDTDQAIALLDGRTLPVKVRFENGLRCTTETCLTRRVDETGGTLVLESGQGALVLQEGWLPPNIPEVTVTVQWEPTPDLDQCVQREGFDGPGLIAQTRACLLITTDPELTPGEATGIQEPAFVFICKPEPTGLSEELEELLQIIKADAGRPLQALRDVDHGTLQQLGFTPTCNGATPEPIGAAPSSGLLHFASAGVRSIADFVTRTFGVGSLHAIDLGQGGEIIRFDSFSRFTLGVLADLDFVGELPEEATTGEPLILSVSLLGQSHHEPGPVETQGVSGIDVVFTVTAGTGTFSDPSDDVGGSLTTVTIPTDANGTASATFFVGDGANVVTAVAMQDGEAVSETQTFSVTGVPPLTGSLRFVQQPTTTVAGETMTPPVVIELLDPTGNRLTSAIARVTIGHPPDAPDECLILQTSALAIEGLATFSNIQVNGACEGVQMGAAGGGGGYVFPIILSESFDILPEAPSGQIAFTSDRTEDEELFLMNVDGTGVVNLTNTPGADVGSIWSPDGSRIAFQSLRNDAGDIFLMNADGSAQTNLTPTGAFELRPTWSPDGTKLVFMERGTTDRLFVINADGTGRTLLADDAGFPAWSPDGSKIAFATDRDGNAEIYVMNADGTNPVNLTNHPGFDLVPVWSPDGTQIMWITARDGNAELYVMNADGSNPTNLTNNPARDGLGSWSPDGFFIVFDSERDGNEELYIMRSNGSDVIRLTTNPASDSRPAWRP